MPKKTVFPREALVGSRRFSHIQEDFLRAILHKDQYTIPEAEKAIREFFKEKARDA